MDRHRFCPAGLSDGDTLQPDVALLTIVVSA